MDLAPVPPALGRGAWLEPEKPGKPGV